MNFFYYLFFGFESTQLACRVQPERAQVEEQCWKNLKVVRREGTPAILLWRRHSHTQIYVQTRNIIQQTSAIAIWFKFFFFLVWFGNHKQARQGQPKRTQVVLVCYATTQLANQLQQTRIQVVRSNKVARKRLTDSNSTPAMDLRHIHFVLK